MVYACEVVHLQGEAVVELISPGSGNVRIPIGLPAAVLARRVGVFNRSAHPPATLRTKAVDWGHVNPTL